MSNIKKLFLLLIFLAFIILLNSGTSYASENLYLNNLDFEVEINTDGSMDVSEIWDIDVKNTNTLYKTFNLDSSKFSAITNVSVSEIKNFYSSNFSPINQWMHHITKNCYYGGMNKDGQFEIAWGIGMDNTKGTKKYKISYTVEDAISKNNDCYELYWKFVGENFEVSANKITGKIKLPQKAISKEDIKVWGHTEDLNGEIHVTATDTVEFNLDDFKHGKYVEIRIAMPSYFSIYSGRSSNKTLQDIIDEETVWAEEANKRREFAKNINNLFALFVILISIICEIFLIKNIRKKSEKLKQMEKFKPTQEFKYYREIPNENTSPGEALMLLKQNVKEFLGTEIGGIFSSILLDLSLKKLIEFETQKEENKKDKIVIKLLQDNSVNIIRNDEKGVYDFLLKACRGKEKQITFKELEKFIKAHSTDVLILKRKIENQAKKTILGNNQADKKAIAEKEKTVSSIVLYVLGLTYGFILSLIAGVFNQISFIGTIPVLITLIIGLKCATKMRKKINVFTQIRSR